MAGGGVHSGQQASPVMPNGWSSQAVGLMHEELPHTALMTSLHAGDIVVCWSPTDPHSHITSRLRAVPGQLVQQQQQQPGYKKPVMIQVG